MSEGGQRPRTGQANNKGGPSEQNNKREERWMMKDNEVDPVRRRKQAGLPIHTSITSEDEQGEADRRVSERSEIPRGRQNSK
jgi:hypothetical protein